MPVLVKPNPKARNPHYLPTSAGGVEKQDTRKAKSARHLSQPAGIVEPRDIQESVHEEISPPSWCSRRFQWFWAPLLWWTWRTCLCTDICSTSQCQKQKSTFDPTSCKCQLEESEETDGKLSYYSAKDRHRSWCESTQFHNIWSVIGNRSILQLSTLEMENYGSSRIIVLGNSLHLWDGKGKYTGNPSLWWQPTHHPICCPEMHAML